RVHRGRLEDDADPLAPLAARAAGVDAEDGHVAGVALPVTLEDLDRRRLACAVRAEQAEDLAGADLEAHSLQRDVRAVRLAEGAHLDGERRRGARLRRRLERRGGRVHRPSGRSMTTMPAGGNRGSGPPVSSAAIRLQSGWWPTTTTRPARPTRT